MRILLLEDEPEMAAALITALGRRDIIVDHVSTLADAELMARIGTYDVLVLDRRLPDGEGLDLIPVLRFQKNTTPVLILTALAGVDHRVEGLDGGADDYLGKPFAIEELLARLRALQRRSPTVSAERFSLGNLTVDPRSNEVAVAGGFIDLARREYLVVEALIRRANRIVTRSMLVDAVYTIDDQIESNALDAHVSRIRRKLGIAGASVEIRAVRNIGYLLRVSS
ncbi:response regulator transcription factor [Neorhizobium sp. BETTINA12A]|uniref:response regulator n=1 Tax=Neorhizobium sp. BETTINA12A TaxID=2908924 RepID=UPI001FF5E95D|nr:response regulator transcription factor [Neorhizobium sp. BETTINA12A]MCJ9750645.1 response regulator transcription factor [Neorhizobium sp. BETTINA12A]